MSSKDKREKYINKILKEIKDNDYKHTDKWFGKLSLNSIIKSEKTFEKFKDQVKEARYYEKERIKIQNDLRLYHEKLTDKKDDIIFDNIAKGMFNKDFDRLSKSEIKNVREIMQKAKEYNINLNKFTAKGNRSNYKDLVKEEINGKITKQVKNQILIQQDYITEDGTIKKVGGIFKNVKGEEFIKPYLNRILEKMKTDKKVVANADILLDYLYDTLLPELYESGGYEVGRSAHKPSFWEEIGQKLENFYYLNKDHIYEEIK